MSKSCVRVRFHLNNLASATARRHCVHECIRSALEVRAETTDRYADLSGVSSTVGQRASRRKPFAPFPYPRLEWISSTDPRPLPESERVLRRDSPLHTVARSWFDSARFQQP